MENIDKIGYSKQCSILMSGIKAHVTLFGCKTIMYSINQKAITELPSALFSKRVLLQNHLNKSVFDLHQNELASETHLHIQGFTPPGLFLKQKLRNSQTAYPEQIFDGLSLLCYSTTNQAV